MNTQNLSARFTAGPNELFALTRALLAIGRRVAVLLAAVILTTGLAQAANLLSNGDFSLPNSNANPTDWTPWTYGTGGPWVQHQVITTELIDHGYDNTGIYDHSYAMKLGVFNGTGNAGLYQIVGGGPNADYTLTCDAGMQAWWLMYGEIRLIFLDASNAVITNYVVRTTDSLHNEYNGGLGDIYDVGVVMRRWTNSAVSPPGTAFVKVEFVGTGANGGNCWFDNAVLTSPLVPPVIGNIYPNGAVLQQATNKLSFSATSALAITNIVVILNGVDVSSNLVITGPLTSRTVLYTNLQPNTVYTAAITVTDAGNLSAPATVNFDTFAPSFSWEAEDYDYDSGQFINSPILTNTPTAGSYFGVTGTEGIDFHDYSADGTHAYRDTLTMATEACSDVSRQNFINAGVSDYNVGWFNGAGFPGGNNVGITSYDAGEWVNYTRNLPAGTNNIYARVANGNGGFATIPLSKVVGGWGTSTQTTTQLGAFRFPANGWASYAYVPLTDRFGNRIAVALSGTNTLRVTAGSGGNLNFFMLVAADTQQPTITSVYPDGGTLLQGTNKFTFTVSSASHSIAQSNVVVTLNGVTNNSLTFSGSSSSWQVSLPLALDVTNYTAVISVADNVGNTHSTTVYFDTFNPASYAFEAEDFDFSGGQFIDNPMITSVPDVHSYFGRVGTTGVDSSWGDVLTPFTAPFRYRAEADTISSDVCSDTPTRALVAAQLTNSLAFNYNIAYWSTNAWLNYTRTYPTGTFKVYARLAAGDPNAVQLDKVGGSATNYLGTFSTVPRGYNFFDWIPLVNTNTSQMVTLTLGGVATLRTTTLSGNVNPNSYLLVPLVTAPEALQYSYSGGVLTLTWVNPAFHLQAQTNGLSGSWANYPGGATSPVNIPVNSSPRSVFFRLSN
jgi:hypothetical protein